MKFLIVLSLLLTGCAASFTSTQFEAITSSTAQEELKPADEPEALEEQEEPEEKQSIEDLITEGIHYWLSTKMTQEIYNAMSGKNSWWRKSPRVSTLEMYFYVIADATKNDSWYNISVIIEEFRWLDEYDLKESEFLEALMDAIDTYEFKPEVEEEDNF